MGMPESATLEQMHRFAEGVMPHFNGAVIVLGFRISTEIPLRRRHDLH